MNRVLYIVLFLAVLFSGCAGMKEATKGFLGVSTKILEDDRKGALKKEFNYDLVTCRNKVREILQATGAYIYADDLSKNLLAVYVSEEDTTPVGVFLTQAGRDTTLVEVSSPSVFGKEKIFGDISIGLTKGLNALPKKGEADASKHKT